MAHSKKNNDNMAARAIVPNYVDETTTEEEILRAAAEKAAADRAAVLADLNREDVMWQTAAGIADHLNLAIGQVDSILRSMSASLIRSAVPDDQGRIRYTTLRNYRAHAGILRRVLDTLSDQVR